MLLVSGGKGKGRREGGREENWLCMSTQVPLCVANAQPGVARACDNCWERGEELVKVLDVLLGLTLLPRDLITAYFCHF